MLAGFSSRFDFLCPWSSTRPEVSAWGCTTALPGVMHHCYAGEDTGPWPTMEGLGPPWYFIESPTSLPAPAKARSDATVAGGGICSSMVGAFTAPSSSLPLAIYELLLGTCQLYPPPETS